MYAHGFKILLAALILASLALVPSDPQTALAAGKTFYIDCVNGNNNASGTSPSNAWKTLKRTQHANIQPGDALLLKRGCTWQGPLEARWHGTANNRIYIGAYGNGAKPVIKNAVDGNVKITGSYQRIEEIQSVFELSSYAKINQACANQPQAAVWRVGFNFVGGHHNTLSKSMATGGSLGVNFTNSSHHNKFTNNEVVGNHGAWNVNSQWPQGGTGVFLHGDANEVSYNFFQNNHTLCWDESITIEMFDATNSKIHHNTAYGDKDFIEAGSAKIQSNNNVVAYNTHTTNRTSARFLITVGQGQAFGPVWNTKLYNNVAYYTGDNSQGVVCSSCGPNVLTMRNNVIVAKGKAVYSGGKNLDEAHNIFWKTGGGALPHDFIQGFTPHSTTLVASPGFVAPGQRDFHIAPTSPAVNRGSGASVDNGFTTDIDGDPVPLANKVDIGVDEAHGATETSPELEQGGPAIAVPGRLEAEDYKPGGAGVGYHDTTSGNAGGACRNGDVDLANANDTGGGCNVGYIVAGEWLAYDVQIAAAGDYTLNARVATIHAGRTFHVTVDGTNVSGPIQVPNTGGWQNWANVAVPNVTLPAGAHEVRIVMDSGDFNINYIDFQKVAGAVSSIAIPGRIQAEDYKSGGEGAGYSDTTRGNAGGACRDDDVDLAQTQDAGGGCNLSHIAQGEWVAYDVDVQSAGAYSFTARVATPYSGRSFHIEIDGQNVTGSIHVPKTNGWQNWANVSTGAVTLAAGMHELRIVMETSDFNLNFIEVSAVEGAGNQSQPAPAPEQEPEQEPTPEPTPEPAPAPEQEALGAPGELVATPSTSQTIDLTWMDNSAEERGFAIERSDDGVNWTVLTATLPAGTTTFSDRRVALERTYYYRVKALGDAAESDYSNVASASVAGS